MEKKDLKRILRTYYESLEVGKILGRKCMACSHIEFPPYLACNACGHLDTEWCEIPGKGVLTQIMFPSPVFANKALKEEVGEYCVGAVKPENSDEMNTCIIGVSPDRVDELRNKIPVPVKPIIVQADGYKTVFWELDE